MRKVISPALSPNLRFADVATSVHSLLIPHELQLGDSLNFAGLYLKKMFHCPNVFMFMRAREGQYMLFKALGVKKKDEIIVQAFTCAAVVQPILWAGAKPVYVDISEKHFSMDSKLLIDKITSRTKVIILQSTFGIPNEFDQIRKIAKEKGIFLLLDLAHTFNPKEITKYKADAFLLSFGRDKAISSVTGGALVVSDKNLSSVITDLYRDVPYPNHHEIVRFLLHPLITYCIRIFFFIYPALGKSATKIYRSSRIVPRPVNNELELTSGTIQKYPNALARLLMVQFKAVDEFNKKRIEWVRMYKKNNFVSLKIRKEVPLLRVPYLVSDRDALVQACKKELIYLGTWYSHVIDPGEIPLKALGYKKNECPIAEKISSQIINLPVNPTLGKEDITRVIRSIKKYELSI